MADFITEENWRENAEVIVSAMSKVLESNDSDDLKKAIHLVTSLDLKNITGRVIFVQKLLREVEEYLPSICNKNMVIVLMSDILKMFCRACAD